MRFGGVLRRLVGVGGVLGLLGVSAVGRAQEVIPGGDDARAAARPIAADGLKAYEAGEHARAAELFAEADKRYPAPQYRLYRARALVKAGRLGAAAAAYRSVLMMPAPVDAPPSFTDAQKAAVDELAALRGKVGVLAMVLTGEASEGATVRLDGEVWSAAERAGREVDPGEHTLTVEGEGLETVSQGVSALPGVVTRVEIAARRRVAVPAPAAVEKPPVVVPVETRARPRDEATRPETKWHEGQLGLVARGDIDVLHGGVLGAPGLTYGLWGPLELGASALLSGHYGAEAGLTWYVLEGDWKPLLAVAAPVFFEESVLVGGRAGVGLQWDASTELGAFASVSAVYFPLLPEGLEAFYVLPSLGVQGRL